MPCQRCDSERLCEVYAKSSDLNNGSIVGQEFDGYLPHRIGLGDDGDGIEMTWCLECGQIQGEFPLPTPNLNEDDEEDDIPEEDE